MRLLKKLHISYIISFSWSFVFLMLFSIYGTNKTMAEGTNEIMPYDTCLSRLNLEPSFSGFAMYGCLPKERLNIRIANIGEKIYYGFGNIYDGNQDPQFDLYYRIKDPNGNIVVNQAFIPTSSNGFISSYNEAINGPSIINTGGYSALSYTPTMTGDYYMEFHYVYAGQGDRREIEYFDITVTNSNNQAIKGRIWSKEWQFTVTASPQPNPYDNPFYGELYIYSDDSIVTSVDFNGLKPYVFAVTANPTGCSNTGNIIQDRKSVQGKFTYPQYKIFLNDPDSIVFPSGIFGNFTDPISFEGCPGNYCVNVSLNKPGAIQLLIDLNGIYGYQVNSADILIVQNVSSGTTCIPWNGIDGLGNAMTIGTPIKFKATYVSGLTHMPIYDAENNPNGYKIHLVRPQSTNTTFNLYWDDTNIPSSIPPPSIGCNNPNGCHIWNNMFGDDITINTWWYSASNVFDSLEIIYSEAYIDTIIATNTSCPNIDDGAILISVKGGGTPYTFKLNGANIQLDSIYANLGAGDYYITVMDNNNCTIEDSISVFSPPPLTANIISTSDTCYRTTGAILAEVLSGNGPYQYSWSTNPPTTSYSITNMSAGNYTVTITDNNNCKYIFSGTINNTQGTIADFNYFFRTSPFERNIVDFTFTGIGANTFSWDFGDNTSSSLMNPTHQYYNNDTSFIVELIASSGVPFFCKDTIIKQLSIMPPFNIYTPTAFTPNGDGINDSYNVVASRIKEYHIYLYNRWGQLIFEGESLNQKWDGRYNGKSAPDGVYSYLIKVIGDDDRAFEKVGTVLLYR